VQYRHHSRLHAEHRLHGKDSFGYTIDDGYGGTATATVSFSLGGGDSGGSGTGGSGGKGNGKGGGKTR
jgi:hypothetical protein